MPPKRRTRGGSNSSGLFDYNNKVELTFKSQPKALATNADVGDSGSDDDSYNLPVLKKKMKGEGTSSSSSESSSASDSEDEFKKLDADKDLHEIPDDDDDYFTPRPLTPPPNIPSNSKSGISRQTVQISRKMEEKMRYLEYLQKDETPPPVAKQSEVVIVGDGYGTPSSVNRKMTIRIRTRAGVERFQLKMNENFGEIFHKLARKHNEDVDSISLSFTDPQGNFQTLRLTDTPNSVNLSIADIIDCVVVHSAPAVDESFENSDNVVRIKIQGSDSRSVKQFKALKNEPLRKIMQEYADFRQIPLSKLKFSFDGEAMMSEQSPDDLDMDNENVVDVQIR